MKRKKIIYWLFFINNSHSSRSNLLDHPVKKKKKNNEKFIHAWELKETTRINLRCSRLIKIWKENKNLKKKIMKELWSGKSSFKLIKFVSASLWIFLSSRIEILFCDVIFCKSQNTYEKRSIPALDLDSTFVYLFLISFNYYEDEKPTFLMMNDGFLVRESIQLFTSHFHHIWIGRDDMKEFYWIIPSSTWSPFFFSICRQLVHSKRND